ncbi:MAG: molybdate ABC transporter substrate-binding protein [Dehalococcoidia bacterium]|nr:molybdate ABC transporter substrate-binding protein [Dehalococcoidia bacterium]
MKKLLRWMPALLAAILLFGSIAGCSFGKTVTETLTKDPADTTSPNPDSVTLDIAAAASLTAALDEISLLYMSSHSWVTINPPTYAGSGVLEDQIKNGMEVDLFFSAAVANMNNLQNGNFIVGSSRKTLLNNNLVLITRKDNTSTSNINSFSDLTKMTSSQVFAIADPKAAPVGVYAMEALAHFCIAEDDIKADWNLQASTTAVLTAVVTGGNDVGIVYMTDYLTKKDELRLIAVAPDEVNAKIEYPVAILKTSTEKDAAQEFIDFLFTEEAAAIFEKYGFALAAQ